MFPARAGMNRIGPLDARPRRDVLRASRDEPRYLVAVESAMRGSPPHEAICQLSCVIPKSKGRILFPKRWTRVK